MTGEGVAARPAARGGIARSSAHPQLRPRREAETCISVPPDKALENDMLFPPPARRAVQFSQ